MAPRPHNQYFTTGQAMRSSVASPRALGKLWQIPGMAITVFLCAIMPFACWSYTRVPQGYLSSGDRYNSVFDAVQADWRCRSWVTLNFVTCVGQAGIVLILVKYQFPEMNVDFVGFKVSDSSIKPLPKYLDSIKDLPSPTSATDIRSLFAHLRDMIVAFKLFLSLRCKFL